MRGTSTSIGVHPLCPSSPLLARPLCESETGQIEGRVRGAGGHLAQAIHRSGNRAKLQIGSREGRVCRRSRGGRAPCVQLPLLRDGRTVRRAAADHHRLLVGGEERRRRDCAVVVSPVALRGGEEGGRELTAAERVDSRRAGRNGAHQLSVEPAPERLQDRAVWRLEQDCRVEGPEGE